MNAEERRRMDAAMAQARQRLRRVLFGSAIVALVALFVYLKACN